MALVVFRSKAAAEIFMFAESANRILAIIGKEQTAKGVITADQLADALTKLQGAVDEEKAELKAATDAAHADQRGDAATGAGAITLGQRAFPLLEMLRAASKRNVDVTWGV